MILSLKEAHSASSRRAPVSLECLNFIVFKLIMLSPACIELIFVLLSLYRPVYFSPSAWFAYPFLSLFINIAIKRKITT